MIYSIDTCALITLYRQMPPDIVESLWLRLDEMGKDGTLLVSEEVRVELAVGHDGLFEWVKDRSGLIVSSGEVQVTAADIIASHDIVDPEQTSNHADPWVIAVAEDRDATVVGNEKKRKPGAPLEKIPDVCEARGVRYLRHLDFLRDAKIKV